MNKFVLAISGGVDSVVLLDMFAKHPDSEIIVAHFDHGIRQDSADDAKFVESLAKKYGCKFETKREELGSNASEELARDRRYEFLRTVAKKYDARLVTAHHADDVIESIAINLTRGTGWRGLAVLDSGIIRPLTNMTKQEIIEYAKKNKLTWHEDSTNISDDYLRNRIRKSLENYNEDSKRQLLGLWAQQKSIKKSIYNEVENLIDGGPEYSRYFFINIDQDSAIECLRHITHGLLTRPQLINLLIIVKVIMAGKVYEAGNGVKFYFTSRNFSVKMLK